MTKEKIDTFANDFIEKSNGYCDERSCYEAGFQKAEELQGQDAVRFATWMEDSNLYTSEEKGVRYYTNRLIKRCTKEELYLLYKQGQ